jgi:arylformamidase
MIATIQAGNKTLKIDFSKPFDISIPIRAGDENVNAFYIPPVRFEAFRSGDFIGDVNQGGSCNVFNIHINPHGNGTHTETVGHISSEKFPIYKALTTFFFMAELISIEPQSVNDDRVITRKQIEDKLSGQTPEAVIIRTLPNQSEKINTHYSGTNPVYMEEKAAHFLREINVKHVLLDMPSIDKEEDSGKLLAHHAFWNYPDKPRTDCTITELIYVEDKIKDGHYLLNLQIASFDNDASPSKPVIYKIES